MQFFAKSFSFLCLASSLSYAQQATETPATTQQITIDGSQSDIEKNREFVAGKLVIGKKTIAESGLQNVGDILRREPAITIGKDGRIGLMGLPGYTQVLVDGMPPIGKDPFDLDLIHVEKIEIIKSATAATGPFGIAGTINIVRRKAESTRYSQLNAGASSIAGEQGSNVSWLNNQVAGEASLLMNFGLSASHADKPTWDRYQQTLIQPDNAQQTILQDDRSSTSTIEYVIGTGEFNWKLDASHNLKFAPEFGSVTDMQAGREQRHWINGRQLSLQDSSKVSLPSYSVPVQWTWRTEEDSSIEVKLGMTHSTLSSTSVRNSASDTSTENHLRTHGQHEEKSNQFLNLGLLTNFRGGHEVEAGASLTHLTSATEYEDSVDGSADFTLAALGTRNSVDKRTYRAFVQDDWRLNKSLALNIGVSAEQQDFALDEAQVGNAVRFRMWSPSVHLLKKIGGDKKRQWRASLTRTFQAPSLTQLILHPRVNSLAPCDPNRLCMANGPDTADEMGNPHLQPEKALGLNFSYTQGIAENSEVSAEYYQRDIARKIGSEMSLASVAWASVPRFVVRPGNLGSAKIQGIDLTVRTAIRDFWKEAPSLAFTGKLGYARSELSDIPGPDNRLDGQTPWHAKLGVTYTAKAWPLDISFDANWLPADWVRDNLTERTFQSRMFTANITTIWKIKSDLRLSLNFDNVVARDRYRVDEYMIPAGTLQQATQSSDYRRVGLRLEIKL